MAGEEVVIRVRGLRTQFGTQVVHDGLDLDVYRGEVMGVVGGSGTGKSVLLRAIVGLIRPAAGKIELFGVDPASLSPSEQSALRVRYGVLFQIDGRGRVEMNRLYCEIGAEPVEARDELCKVCVHSDERTL